MDQAITAPFEGNWTRWSTECSTALHPAPARTLAAFLGVREVADLKGWGVAINTVGADLAERCGTAWLHSPTTPVVVLLRSIGRLAHGDPHAPSLLAEALMVMIEATEAAEAGDAEQHRYHAS